MSVWKSVSRGGVEVVGAAASDESGPFLGFGVSGAGSFGQEEGAHLPARDFRLEERFGLDNQLPGERIGVGREKPRGFLLRS
jgi:hypothetical protein